MPIEKTVGYIKGYVVICAEGPFCERFLNVCMRRGIYLRDVRRMGEDKIFASVSIKGFRELRHIARKTRTRISIHRRQGLPFLLHRYRKRKAVLGGIGAAALILWYLSTHIVGIDISGNERIETAALERALEGFGLHYGAAVKRLDDTLIKNQMMTSFDDLAWIGVNIKGSRAYIEVKERLDTEIAADRDVPCDIVAERSGIIRLLEVKNGQTLVKPNQLVEEGDLLVSGVVDSQVKGIRYVHSFGEIYAETSYKKTSEYPFEITEKIYTGNEKKRYTLSVFGKKLKLFMKDAQPFEFCDKSQETTEYKAPLSVIPSLFVTKESFFEYTPQKRIRSLEEALETGNRELSETLDREIPQDAEIIDRILTYLEVGDRGVEVTVEYLCREDIAKQRTIDKIENLGYDTIDEE